MNQHEISLFSYYIAGPLVRWRRKIAKRCKALAHKITGAWWCAGCETYHHGRVYAFSLDDWLGDGVCSKHLEPDILSKYDARVGKRPISQREADVIIAAFRPETEGEAHVR